jgi:hypothetical protein
MSIEVRRLRSGRPVYDVRLRTPQGKQYTKTLRTRKEAEAFEAEQHTTRVRGTSVDPRGGQVRFGVHAESWMLTGSAFAPVRSSCTTTCCSTISCPSSRPPA